MAYSKLCNKIIESPNNSGKRTENIRIITPHVVVGQAKMDTLGRIFSNPKRDASCNYGVCVDGIVGIVDEDNRSWCSSSNWNDQRAVTIEVASDNFPPYKVDDEIFSKLVELCIDICKRHGFTKMVSTSSLNELQTLLNSEPATTCLLSRHNYYAKKSCPGEYLGNKFEELAKLVSEGLRPSTGVDTTAVMYKVRINGFNDKATALKTVAKMKLSGVNCFLVRKGSSNYAIQLGAFNTEAGAIKMMASMSKKVGKALITIEKE